MTERASEAPAAEGQNPARGGATLVAACLVEFHRAAHRLGSYPPDHPLVPAAVQSVQRSLAAATAQTGSLALQIRADRILYDGEAVEARNPAIRSLAESLFEAGVGSLQIEGGASKDTIGSFLGWLARLRSTGGDHSTGASLKALGLPGVEVRLADKDAARAAGGAPAEPPGLADEFLVRFAGGIFRGAHLDPSATTAGSPRQRFTTALEWGLLEKGPGLIGAELAELEAAISDAPAEARDEVVRIVRGVVGRLAPELRAQMPAAFAGAPGPGEAQTDGRESMVRPEPAQRDGGVESCERYQMCADPVSRKAKAIAIAARLLSDGQAGRETTILASLIREAAPGLLAGSWCEELRDCSVAALAVLANDSEEAQPAHAEAERFVAWLRDSSTIDSLLASAEARVDGPEQALAGLFAATGAEGVARAFETTSAMPPGDAHDRRVHMLSECPGEDLLAGFRSLSVRLDPEHLAWAVALLRRVPLREANILAQESSTHEAPRVRLEALRTIAVVDRRDGAMNRTLERALGDPDAEVRELGFTLLGEQGTDAACALLMKSATGKLGTPEPNERVVAVDTIGRIRTTAARDVLIAIVSDRGAGGDAAATAVAQAAAVALESWDDAAARAALKSMGQTRKRSGAARA